MRTYSVMRRTFLLLSACFIILSLLAGCTRSEGVFPEPSAETDPAEEAASLTEYEEGSYTIPAQETLPPETDAPDPALDVLNHYSNMFIASKVNNYLNVRNAPSTSGDIIGKLAKDAGGEILEAYDNGWYHISSGGIDGFVSSEYCISGEEARAYAPSVARLMVRVTAERLNVRSGPGTEFETWTQLGSSETQAVDEALDGWYKITVNNAEGYISADFAEPGWYLQEAMPWTSLSSASPARQQLFAYAEQFIGIPYMMGGTSLSGGGIDCSSFVQQCLKNALGIGLDRTSRQLATRGYEVSLMDAKPGDLMFYTDAWGTIDHVAFYMGDGKILHASRSFGQVAVSAYNYASEPVLIKNVIGD